MHSLIQVLRPQCTYLCAKTLLDGWNWGQRGSACLRSRILGTLGQACEPWLVIA